MPMDGDGFLVARGPVDLRLGYDGRSIDLGRVEGGHASSSPTMPATA